jgi:FtsZ-interacting cell division protein YlmF
MVDVGNRLRHGESVLLDLGGLSSPVKRRMLDACAGLVYGLDASMARTMTDRYLLKPSLDHPQHGSTLAGRPR